MGKVELVNAFMWTCDHCGIDNFERGITAEFSEDERVEMKIEHGIPAEDHGNWMLAPDTVICKGCGEGFETMHYRDEDSELDDDIC